MSNGILSFKHLLLLTAGCIVFFMCRADVPKVPLPTQEGQRVLLKPYFTALSDHEGALFASVLYRHPESFVPLDSLKRGAPTDYYWLKASFQTDSTAPLPEMALSFMHLTYVDVYLFRNGMLAGHNETGAFRPQSEINERDGRLFATLHLERGNQYTLLLRVHHTKHYQPMFDFALQYRRAYIQRHHRMEVLDAAMQGAIGIFFLYTLISLLVGQFRPYRWLLLFIAGVGMYVISSRGYFIDWFFPESPSTGWLFNVHFLYLGLIGMYMLVIDFWQLRQYNPWLYRFAQVGIVLAVVSSITCFFIDYYTGNYHLTNNINFAESPVRICFAFCALWFCWRRLSTPQRFLAYGLLLFELAGIFVIFNALHNEERALASTTIIGEGAVVIIFLLFSTGLKEEMRQHEIAKQAVLQELSRLQQHQNILLEKKVEERTEELNISNKRLLKQKNLLAERNSKIETLINELSHRVKNNLQLLYSLLSLQLPLVKDDISRDILRGNIGKIRAMMLVNQKLFNFEKGGSTGLRDFITELASHLQKIYDPKEKARIQHDIPADIQLSNKHTLAFGLILSELFTNTFKHAFHDHPNPCIQVKVTVPDYHLLEFVYSDNGVGLQETYGGEKFTMGIPLIKDLTRQLNGKMEINKTNGLSYSFTIPVQSI